MYRRIGARLVPLAWAALMATGVGAQTPAPLTLRQAYEAAWERQPEAAGQKGRVGVAHGVAHQQHVTCVQRLAHHALAVQALAHFTHQQQVDAVGNLQAVARVHGLHFWGRSPAGPSPLRLIARPRYI